MRTKITENSMELFQNLTNTLYVIQISLLQIQPIGAKSYTSSSNLKRRTDVVSIFWALEQLHGGFSDIGAHQDFQKPNSYMPKLLWVIGPKLGHSVQSSDILTIIFLVDSPLRPLGPPPPWFCGQKNFFSSQNSRKRILNFFLHNFLTKRAIFLGPYLKKKTC